MRTRLALVLLLALPAPGWGDDDPAPAPPPVIADEITVTATRTERRLGDTAASVVVLTADELAATAAPALDDALRQVPGFSLFRRSGSRFANPTSQGMTLRGLGASGASRAVVLVDGIPLNDPFGGWIYWGRVPRPALDRVEVLRGAASDLYGSAALGGAVQVLRREAGRPLALVEAAYGERGSPEGALFLGGRPDGSAWGASLAAAHAATDGYVLVGPADRGPVDTPARSRHDSADLTLERRLAAGGRAFLRGAYFAESRGNGTPLQENETAIRSWSAGADRPAAGGALALRAWGSDQELRQTFSAVAPDRASERLTRSQRVPAEALGLSSQWSRALGRRHSLVAGLELQEVAGESAEAVFTPGGRVPVSGEGRQRTGALFLEDLVELAPRLSLVLGARLDRWRNFAARETNAGGTADLPGREESAVSPRLSLLFRATDAVALTASASRAFRAPTLNELYRSFRVGDVVTLANPDLRAERLAGGEAGALVQARGGRWTGRGTLYWMEIEDNVANVTLATEPGLVTRQRRNLGRTRSRGLEAELAARAGRRWTLSAGYLLADSTVRSFPAEPSLEGLRLPQVPRHQATLQARFDGPRLAAGLQARWSSAQPEDDRNTQQLAGFTALDALVSRPLGRGLAAFAAVENLFDRRYEIGRTPVATYGPPRQLRIGLRFERGRP